MLGPLILGLLALAFLLWLVLRRPSAEGFSLALTCPACKVALKPLAEHVEASDDAERSYEVFACNSCELAFTAVHGVASAWAYCPMCKQRSLQVQSARLPGPKAGPPVARAVEICHLCGFEDSRLLGGQLPVAEAREGRVIPFPGRQRRR